jgi:hypothetical protein
VQAIRDDFGFLAHVPRAAYVQVFGCHAVVEMTLGVGRRPKIAKAGNRGVLRDLWGFERGGNDIGARVA